MAARGHGGKRTGCGRKPTRERFARPVEQAEKRIADRLPDLVDKLLGLAEAGDLKAVMYAIDRIMGKPQQSVEADVQTDGRMKVVIEYANADAPGDAA